MCIIKSSKIGVITLFFKIQIPFVYKKVLVQNILMHTLINFTIDSSEIFENKEIILKQWKKYSVKLELIQYNCPILTYSQPFHHQVPHSNGYITQKVPLPLAHGLNVEVSFSFI